MRPQTTASLHFPPSSKYRTKHTYAANLICCVMPTTCLVLAEFHHVKQTDPNKDVNIHRTHIQWNKHESLHHAKSCDVTICGNDVYTAHGLRLTIICSNLYRSLLKTIRYFYIPVAARSRAWVCGSSLAGIVGSNPAGSWISVSCECCVLSGRGLCVRLLSRPVKFCRLWCVWVSSWSLDNKAALAH